MAGYFRGTRLADGEKWMPTTPQPTAVEHWLGLGPTPPEGLHGPRRLSLLRRHMVARGGKSVREALIETYDKNREVAIMRLLRPQVLDDALWRTIYALIVTSGRVNIYELIQFLTRLTSADRLIADPEAEKHMRWWYAAQAGASDGE